MSSHDQVRQEVLSEAQEAVEEFGSCLLEFEAATAPNPARLNHAFRQVHSLKGLAGLLSNGPLEPLAHQVENLLDELRLDRLVASRELWDALFDAVTLFRKLIESPGGGEEAARLISRMAAIQGGSRIARRAGDRDKSVLDRLAESERILV